MTFWIIAGSIAWIWILCVSFMLAIFKGGHTVRGGNRYERELYYRHMAKMQKFNDFTKGKKRAARVINEHIMPVSESVVA